jgi:dihydroflavonol-4-reductase
MNTVLVTGASGFVGGHVVEALARNGIRPRCLVRPTSRMDFIEQWAPEFVVGDVTSPASLAAAVEGVDGIVHCAGVIRASSLPEYLRVNAEGCDHLYRACRAAHPSVQSIVHISSLAAYGPSAPDRPIREGQERRPISHYGRSKLAGHLVAEAHMDRLPITILVPPAVYGPFDRAFLGLFACVKRGVTPVIGRSERWISLIYAKDLARAALACLRNKKAVGNEYFLEDGHPHAWRDVTSSIGQAMHTSFTRIRIPLLVARLAGAAIGWGARCAGKSSFFDRDRQKDFFQPAWTCSSARIRAELGFSPQYTLSQGMEETVLWYQRHHWL